MYLIDSIVTLFNLPWAQPKPSLRSIPPHIKRTYVETSDGPLELLVCEPKVNPGKKAQPPIFFAHGGYGSAGVWLEWISYLHEHEYSGTLYAYSVRNHGASYTLPYRQMVWKTPFEHVQSDMMACLKRAKETEKQRNPDVRDPILVGHSSGGGLTQYLLSGCSPDSKLRTKASGLCLVGSITPWGSYDLYYNWWKHDKWFPFRSLLHGLHPSSPLSSDQLVHGAFFGHKFPLSQASQFRSRMPAYESMGWPSGMYGNSFLDWWRGNPSWLSAKDIYSNLHNAEDGRDNVCVMVGKEDMMYRPEMWETLCKEYRGGLAQLKLEKKVDEATTPARVQNDKSIEAVSVASEGGVRLILVEDSGHHVQNDVYHDQAAEAFLRWANQV